jgi:hypothetical protein
MNENIHMIQNTYNKIGESWKSISLLTIKNCFKHSGFYKSREINKENDEHVQNNHNKLMKLIRYHMSTARRFNEVRIDDFFY